MSDTYYLQSDNINLRTRKNSRKISLQFFKTTFSSLILQYLQRAYCAFPLKCWLFTYHIISNEWCKVHLIWMFSFWCCNLGSQQNISLFYKLKTLHHRMFILNDYCMLYLSCSILSQLSWISIYYKFIICKSLLSIGEVQNVFGRLLH